MKKLLMRGSAILLFLPVLLPREAWDDWLDPRLTDAKVAVSMLQAPVAMAPRKVSRAVSHVGTDGPELIEPLGE